MKNTVILCIVLVLSLLNVAYGVNILCLMAVASKSHYLWNRVLVNGLAAKGYNITVFSADMEPKKLDNLHYIHAERTYQGLLQQNKTEELNEDLKEFITFNQFQQIKLVLGYFEKNCEGVVRSDGLQVLLNYPDDFKFDLVIWDYTTGPCVIGFLHKFKYPPLVSISAFLNPPYNLDIVGGHVYPGYIPYFTSEYNTDMNFFQRLYNTGVYYADYWYRQYILIPKMDEIVRPYFPADMPYIDEIQRKSLLALVNSHPAVDYAEPTASNVIEVGGLQITDPDPLPKDIEAFINTSTKGAVFISMGTNVKSEFLGSRRCQMFYDTVAEFPEYNFLWKIDSAFLNKSPPKNLLTREWFPQKDVLAHPRIKAFVTHAGGLSTQEAFWYGVPMVGLPVLADQHRNLRKSILMKVAVKVDLMTMTKHDLHSAIKTILEDKTYSDNIKRRSQLYRDRPMKPLETAIWWIEYAMRTKNLEHLRSPVLDMGVIRSNLFDVIAFVTISCVSLLCCIVVICLKICTKYNKITQNVKHSRSNDKKYKTN